MAHHHTRRAALQELHAYIALLEATTFRSQAQAIVQRGAQYVANAVTVLQNSKFSQSARLNFRARVSGMLRRAAATILDLGWQSGGGEPGKAPVKIKQDYMLAQQTFLSRWFGQIKQSQSIPGGVGRAQMYANSLMELYREGWEAAQHAITGVPKLPATPRDGTTLCLMNCLCRWEVQKKSSVEYWAYWRITPAESCATCLCRAERWNPLKLTKVGAATPGAEDGWLQTTSGNSTCALYK